MLELRGITKEYPAGDGKVEALKESICSFEAVSSYPSSVPVAAARRPC